MRTSLIFLASLFITGECEKNLSPPGDWVIKEPVMVIRTVPIFPEKDHNDLLTIRFEATGTNGNLTLEKISILFSEGSSLRQISSLSAWHTELASGPEKRELFGITPSPVSSTKISGKINVSPGMNSLVVGFTAKPDAGLSGTIRLKSVSLSFSDRTTKTIDAPTDAPPIRFGRMVRKAGQDDCNTYRIPGLARTNRGTLIAVFDNRYESSTDLQGNIDVGMSRSTDGGETWQPMKAIIDMDKWGGKPEAENGAGDPCILVDKATGTIWVAALWLNGSPGLRAWNASAPGLDPGVTGQFVVVKSNDDGITWSQPVNMTSQLKDPVWRLLLQGPGNGITLSDGTLVFPAQYRDADGLPYSTIAYSTDHGATWHIGTGAKGNTTESQCVQLSDGSIMLNMRDNRNTTIKDTSNGRAVTVTRDLGKTWTIHPSSNSALPEPVCMASLISANLTVSGERKKVLFFSNPDNKTSRSNMTIKASFDEGMTWPVELQVVVNEDEGYGYSCLSMVMIKLSAFYMKVLRTSISRRSR